MWLLEAPTVERQEEATIAVVDGHSEPNEPQGTEWTMRFRCYLLIDRDFERPSVRIISLRFTQKKNERSFHSPCNGNDRELRKEGRDGLLRYTLQRRASVWRNGTE